jgi:glycosyltransferase involved in cell wall biosynthesis
MGRRDTPTDGVEDYCTFLGRALTQHDVKLEQLRTEWSEKGWKAALQALEGRAEDLRGKWVFVQYTALAWSSRGFPFGTLRTLDLLRRCGARVAVVFHEFTPQEAGHFLVRPVRAVCQSFVIRRLYARADLAIFTVPAAKIAWLPANHPKAASIPIGANIPEPRTSGSNEAGNEGSERTVAVFCFTPGINRELEVEDIVHAMRTCYRSGQKTRLVILGRGSQEVRAEIEERLSGSGVTVSATGLLPAEEISMLLLQTDALLFVSGQVSQRRGSALAGIACGLPVVGYAGAAEGTPIAEAGLQLAPYRNREALAAALARVLGDADWRNELRRRSVAAQHKYFSWDAIAEKYAAACAHQAISEASLGEARGSSLHSQGIS